MKTQALILLFPFAVFLTETAVLPLETKTTCSKMSCIKMKRTTEMKCQGKKGHDQKPSGKCNNTPDCSTCPVCLAFIFLPQYEWTANYFPHKKNYRLVNAGYLTCYIPPVWKPPNSCFFYSLTT